MEPLLDDPALGVLAQHPARIAHDQQARGPTPFLLDGGADMLDRGPNDALVGTARALQDRDG